MAKETEEQKDLRMYQAIEDFRVSVAGGILIEKLNSEIEASVDNLCGTYQDLEQPKLVSIIAEIAAKRDFVRTLVNSSRNKATVIGFMHSEKERNET
jgi:hypothetical protein